MTRPNKRSRREMESGSQPQPVNHTLATTFRAPLYMPGRTDVTLIIGPERLEFRANCNILASQSKFFEVACYNENFLEANEKVIKLPEVKPEPMIKVLEWLYRSKPRILYDDWSMEKTVNQILDVLHIAKMLLINGLVEVYSKLIGKKINADIENWWNNLEDRSLGTLKVINALYNAGGSFRNKELMKWLARLDKDDREIISIASRDVENPNGRLFQELAEIALLSECELDDKILME